MSRPYIAIPIGDPAGIGPEIVIKALADPATAAAAKCVVVGDRGVMAQAMAMTKIPLRIRLITAPEEGEYEPGVLNLMDLKNIDPARFHYGQISAMCGQAAFDYIKTCITLAMAGKVAAVATTPINKEALKAAACPISATPRYSAR